VGNTKEKEGKFKRFWRDWKGKIWFFINMFFTIIYLVWRIFFTIPFEYGIVSIVAGFALLIVEVLGMVEAFVHYANMYSVKGYDLPEVPLDMYPHVDVFIATYSEEPALLYKTINGCKYMDYPDKSKVHIYLCDDNRRPEMRALAAKMGVNYLDREDNEGAKAGNLNNALAHSNSPYVVTLDADMIPKSDFLLKTIPYFVDAEIKNKGRKEEDKIKLGFLQSPQAFYNPDLFQFNLFSEGRIPNEQDYFYKDIQVARTRTNSVIYGGSNTVLAREALEAIGGFYTKAITEDFATGILIQKAGYVSMGIGEPLASGMSATDLQGLIQQRVRWGRGVIATGRKMHIYTCKDMSFAQKINYWASIWYWYAPLKRLIYMLSPLLYATFGFMVFKCTLPQVLVFWLPMYISSNVSLKMLSHNIRNTKWTSIYENVLFPFMLIPIILETFGISLKKFKVTDKEARQSRRGQNLIYMIPFLILIVLSVIGLINCITIMFDSGSFGPIVVVFWIVYNLYLLIMSLFFVDGRVLYRKKERVPVALSCRMRDEKYDLEGVTKDISEGGISVYLDEPRYFREGEWLEVDLWSDRYKSKLLVEVVYVSKINDRWSYSMKILDYKDTYDEYLQLMYDRVPVLPAEIKKDSGSFEDLKLNTKKRITSPFYQKRQFPRVFLDAQVPYKTSKEVAKEAEVDEKGELHVMDFNYCFVGIDAEKTPKTLTLHPDEKYAWNCEFVEELQSGLKLYKVLNVNAIWGNVPVMEELLVWLIKTNEEATKKKSERDAERKAQEKAEKKKEDFNETKLV